ncbi:oligosaccharide flippase family protein [Aurantimonas sp. DM33-3]|uniref:oligosaccharide flippase family protein n=1 Tax=Aurantimonas sp. DM33-3 TaxID=2766955 RepID=UPI001651D39E|nr:oligosaccharide flippase family protein [Aurantimonas sp. DM33-3]MBC6715562.1 oligosaccharide flippase family protein [Aurantimonas sp. DM33-3]
MTANFDEALEPTATRGVASQSKSSTAIGWATVGFWAGQSVSLGVFLILVTILAPIDIGHFALATVVQMFIGAFVDKAMGEVVIQRAQLSDDMLSTAFFMDSGLAILLVATVVLFAEPIASLLGAAELALVLQVLAIASLMGTLGNIPLALLEKQLNFRCSIKIALAAQIAAGTAALTLALLGWGIWALVANQIVETVVKSSLAWITVGWRPKLRVQPSVVRHLLGYWTSTIGFRLTYFARVNTDRLIIGMLLGPTILGYYTIAYRLVQTATDTFCEGIAKSILAVLSLLQGSRTDVADVFLTYVRTTAILAFPLFAGLAVIGPDLVILLFGTQWSQTAQILPYLSLVGLAVLMLYLFGIAFRAIGYPQANFWLFATAAFVDAIILVTLLPVGLYICLSVLVLRAWLYLPAAAYVFRRLFRRPFNATARTLSVGTAGGAALGLLLVSLSAMPAISSLDRPEHFAVLFTVAGVFYLAFVSLTARSFLFEAACFIRQSLGRPPAWRKRNA